jgi:hypothetical protein
VASRGSSGGGVTELVPEVPEVNCTGNVGEDFTGDVPRVKGPGAYINGTTAAGCCDACTKHLDPMTGELDCLSWTYAPLAQPPHLAGSCWHGARVLLRQQIFPVGSRDILIGWVAATLIRLLTFPSRSS